MTKHGCRREERQGTDSMRLIIFGGVECADYGIRVNYRIQEHWRTLAMD